VENLFHCEACLSRLLSEKKLRWNQLKSSETSRQTSSPPGLLLQKPNSDNQLLVYICDAKMKTLSLRYFFWFTCAMKQLQFVLNWLQFVSNQLWFVLNQLVLKQLCIEISVNWITCKPITWQETATPITGLAELSEIHENKLESYLTEGLFMWAR